MIKVDNMILLKRVVVPNRSNHYISPYLLNKLFILAIDHPPSLNSLSELGGSIIYKSCTTMSATK